VASLVALAFAGARSISYGDDPPAAPGLILPTGPPIDVSVTVRPRMPIYEGDPGVEMTLAKSIERGDPANVSRLVMGAHTGTHVDAPCHFLPGAAGASELPLDPFIGPCRVVDATSAAGDIDAGVVEALDLPAGTDRVLLKTPGSRLWGRDAFTRDFIRLNGAGARALIERGVRLVGIDYLSVGDPEAHVALLDRGIGVIEGLDLRAVEPGSYFLVCLPVRIEGADGAPARALLWPL
jgi:arylformamidase